MVKQIRLDDSAAQTIIVYPPEENITVKITLAAAGQSFNGNSGGEEESLYSHILYKKILSMLLNWLYNIPPTSLGYGGAGAYMRKVIISCLWWW